MHLWHHYVLSIAKCNHQFVVYRFNIPESQAQAEPLDGDTVGGSTLPTAATVCKMVGGTNIIAHICIFARSLCDANAKLGHLQL